MCKYNSPHFNLMKSCVMFILPGNSKEHRHASCEIGSYGMMKGSKSSLILRYVKFHPPPTPPKKKKRKKTRTNKNKKLPDMLIIL